MRLKAAFVFCLLAGLVVTVAGLAQEGHPLTGVWYGDWGRNATTRYQLTVQMGETQKRMDLLAGSSDDDRNQSAARIAIVIRKTSGSFFKGSGPPGSRSAR